MLSSSLLDTLFILTFPASQCQERLFIIPDLVALACSAL
jgi:hypothetical protein